MTILAEAINMGGFGGSVQTMINTLKQNRAMLRERGVFKKMSDQKNLKTTRKLKKGKFSAEQVQQAVESYKRLKRKETIRVILIMTFITIVVIFTAVLINNRVFF